MFVSKSLHIAQQNPITDYLRNITYIILNSLTISSNKCKGIYYPYNGVQNNRPSQ